MGEVAAGYSDVGTLDGDEEFYVVDDPSGTPAGGNTTPAGILTYVESNIAATLDTDTDVSGKSWVLDEDTMSSDDATKVPTQQSVKAYVDAQVVESEPS